jgi:hypothetical protein
MKLGIATAAVITAIVLTPALYYAWERYYPSPGPRRDATDYCIDTLRYSRFDKEAESCIVEKMRLNDLQQR